MIPQLPTDNLYKFMTLGGIVIVVFYLWLIRDNSDRLDAALIRYNEAAGQFDVIQTDVEHQLERLQQQVDLVSKLNLDALKPGNSGNPATAQSAISEFSKMHSQYAEALKRREEAYKARIDADHQGFTVKQVLERNRADLNFAKIEFLSGCFLTLLGIVAWYTRHQRFQDQLIALQVEAARNGLVDRGKSDSAN